MGQLVWDGSYLIVSFPAYSSLPSSIWLLFLSSRLNSLLKLKDFHGRHNGGYKVHASVMNPSYCS